MYAKGDQLSTTAAIVSAYVGANNVHAAELPDIIAAVHASLAAIGEPKPVEEPAAGLNPAVPIKKSVTPEYLICLDDGKRFKSLKRHLAVLGMTPDAYRAKWGLPSDYPMVAARYAAKRSELAKLIGLGTDRRALAQAERLMDHTALSPVEHETATLAPVVEEMQLEPMAAASASLKVAVEKTARRRGRPAKIA